MKKIIVNWTRRSRAATPSAIPSEPQKRESRPVRIAHRQL